MAGFTAMQECLPNRISTLRRPCSIEMSRSAMGAGERMQTSVFVLTGES